MCTHPSTQAAPLCDKQEANVLIYSETIVQVRTVERVRGKSERQWEGLPGILLTSAIGQVVL